MSLTVVIAHYRRPDNVDRIAVNLPPWVRFFLLDNAVAGPRPGATALSMVVCVLTSSRNNLATRGYMASQAAARYYCVHDDDLMLSSDHYLHYVQFLDDSPDESHRV